MPYTSAYLDPALYDVVYSKVTADIPFYVDLVRQEGGRALEIGCGTGRVLIPILEQGADIHGLDLEPAMLERLRAKAAAKRLSPELYAGDMRDFTLPRRYRLATIPFRAFLHMESPEDQIRTLRCIREHLEPGGLLAFNVFYPSKQALSQDDGVKKLAIEVDAGGQPVEVWDVSRYDRARQTVAVERQVIATNPDGSHRTVEYGFTLRWIYRFEMELLVRAAGFASCDILGGFDRRPLTKDTDEMVVLARRG